MWTVFPRQGCSLDRSHLLQTSICVSRIVMAYDLEIWFIRAVLFIAIDSNLGPKLVMIRKMVDKLY